MSMDVGVEMVLAPEILVSQDRSRREILLSDRDETVFASTSSGTDYRTAQYAAALGEGQGLLRLRETFVVFSCSRSE